MPIATPGRSTIALHALLELSPNLDGKPRERCPIIHISRIDANGRQEIAQFRSDVERPRLDLPDCSIDTIEIGNILSRVIDEEAWLVELRRVLTPGGYLCFKLPATGPLAWLDARNMYRYVVDITGRGNEPDDTLPTGWHRHYSEHDILQLLKTAGFTHRAIQRVGLGIPEIPQMAGLMVGNFLFRQRNMERRLQPLRTRTEAIDQEFSVPKIGTTIYVLAART